MKTHAVTVLAATIMGICLGLLIAAVFFTAKINELATAYEDGYATENRLNFELYKACEGYRHYLMFILDEHKIEYHK